MLFVEEMLDFNRRIKKICFRDTKDSVCLLLYFRVNQGQGTIYFGVWYINNKSIIYFIKYFAHEGIEVLS